MNQVKREFSCAVNGDTAVLTCYDVIGKMWGGPDEITASNIKKSLDAASKAKSISIRINSPGGQGFEGVAIYNLVKSYGKPVAVFVDGMACSAASIVAMAGDTITMGVGSTMMIHNALTGLYGNAAELRKTAELLDKVSSDFADIYVLRTGVDKAKVQAMMDAETYMSAGEAVTLGFATDTSAPDTATDEEVGNNLRQVIHASADKDENLDYYKRKYALALAVSRKR